MPTRRVTSILFFALVACAPLAAQPSGCPQGSPSVSPAVGTICGKVSSINIPEAGPFTANEYLGIPYAKPPVGEKLRWHNPEAPEPWTVPFQAIQFGKQCPQPLPPGKGSACTASNQSEDCLYLNVWTPREARPAMKLPVMVFIHGGAFYKGTGSSDLYDGTYLADSQNVVVVTFNYRLGILGFLATHDMQSGAGNFGFRDQIMVLKWVQQNIEKFGGDPSQVLLFGESAGAMSVGLHALSSPQSAGLFKAALMESNPLGLPYKTLEQALAVGESYSKLFKCPDLQCLQQKSACQLVDQEDSFSLNVTTPPLPTMSNIFHWTPVIDSSLITGQPTANAANLKVPMLMGTNQDEGLLFAALAKRKSLVILPALYVEYLDRIFGDTASQNIRLKTRYKCGFNPDCTTQLAHVITDSFFTCPNRRLAIQAGSVKNIYMYLFDQVTRFNFWADPNPTKVPACQGEVCHADELPYVFNTAQALKKDFGAAEEALSQRMGGYWTSFAKSQSPGGAWPLFNPSKTYLEFKDSSFSVQNYPFENIANCTLWDDLGYQNSATWDRLLAVVKAPKK